MAIKFAPPAGGAKTFLLRQLAGQKPNEKL